MTTKRQIDQDPDYDSIPAEVQQKRLRLIEQDAREVTVRKIEKIIREQFLKERKHKESELQQIDKRLQEARMVLDRLRACIVMKYYSSSEDQVVQSSPSVHPVVKKYLGKAPKKFHPEDTTISSSSNDKKPVITDSADSVTTVTSDITDTHNIKDNIASRGARLKMKFSIIVGNVSKYIPAESRDENDQATHKWMVYVRGNKANPHIEDVVKKVQFFLHPSYRPNDLVEVSDPPFHLTRRGWGEFPIRVQLHFHNQCNKPVDIIHNIKLDKTYTGLQTLGAETAVDLWLYRKEAKQKFPSSVCKSGTSSSDKITDNETNVVFNNDVSHNENISVKVEKHSEISKTKSSIDSKILIKIEPPDDNDNKVAHLKPNLETLSKVKCERMTPAEHVKKTKSVLFIIPPKVNSTISTQDFSSQSTQVQNFVEKHIQESSKKQSPVRPLCTLPSKTSLDYLCKAHTGNSPTSNSKNHISPKDTSKNNLASLTDFTLNNSLNGLTTFVKCTDDQGRILLVPQSSVVKIPNSLTAKSGNKQNHSAIFPVISSSGQISQSSTNAQKTNMTTMSPKSPKNLSSYMVKVLPNHAGSMNQVILIPTNHTTVSNEHLLKTIPSKSSHLTNCSSLVPKKPQEKISCENITTGKNSAKMMKRDDALLLKKALLSIRLEYYETMTQLVNKVVRLFPLIHKDIDRSCHPYCASSLDVYFSWNIGKQRAAEWHRAKAVRQAILQLIHQKSSLFRSEDVWSTKDTMVWCYKNGYSPRKQFETASNTQHHFEVLNEVSTLAESQTVLEMLEKEDCLQKSLNVEEEEVDIVNVDNDHVCISSKYVSKETVCPDKLYNNPSLLWISPSSPCTDFVKEAASQIGIKFQPCELAPSTMCHVVEEMILTACKEFVTDILRLALSEAFNKIGQNLYPDMIKVEDIFCAIQKLPVCDILTNKYLGVSLITENKTTNDTQLEKK